MNALQRTSRWWTGALYTVALMLVVLPLWEGIGRLGDPAPSQVMWRAASVVSITGVLMIPVVGFVLALVVALVAEHRRVLRTGSVLGMLAALVLLGTMGVMALDALQMRRQVVPERLSLYDQLLVRTLFSQLLFVVILTVASVAAWKSARRAAALAATSAAPERTIVSKRAAAANG